MDKTVKIQFTMQAAGDDGLEFLHLKLKMVNGKISVDVFPKPTNSFSYVLPSTCYPNRNIKNVPKGIALKLRRICDNDEKHDERSEEYQKYLIARDYQPGSVKRQFEEVKKLSRSEARRPKVKSNQVRKLNLFTTYNLSLPNMDTLVKKYFYIVMKTLRNCSLLLLLMPYTDVTKILQNYCLHCFLLTGKLLKAIASLVVIAVTSATIIWFLKTCLIVQ